LLFNINTLLIAGQPLNKQVNQPTSKQQRAKRKSAKREPAAATQENPVSRLTRHTSSPLHHALAVAMTWATGKARRTADV